MDGGEPLASVAYAVLRQDWASGTMTPVLAGSVSLLDLGFETYGLHRVVAQMDARNPTLARMAWTLRTALRLVSPVDHPRQPRRPARAANSSRQASTSVASHTRFRR